jgi:hypothetical protein
MAIKQTVPNIMGMLPDYICLDADRASLPSDASVGKTAFVWDTGITYIHTGIGNWVPYLLPASSTLATINTNLGDPSTHTLTSIVAKIGNLARSITAILGARWNSSGDLGTDIATSLAAQAEISQLGDGDIIAIPSFNTTATTKNASVTLFAIDALGGIKKNIKLSIYLAADAAATFTITVRKTRSGDTTTFTPILIPAIATIATPAAAAVYRYEIGDLNNGLQMDIAIAQSNAGNATNVCDAAIDYEGGL